MTYKHSKGSRNKYDIKAVATVKVSPSYHPLSNVQLGSFGQRNVSDGHPNLRRGEHPAPI